MLGGVLEFKNQLGSEMPPEGRVPMSLATLSRYHNQKCVAVPYQVFQHFPGQRKPDLTCIELYFCCVDVNFADSPKSNDN